MNIVKRCRPVLHCKIDFISMYRSVCVLRCSGSYRFVSSEVRSSRDHDLVGPPDSVSNLRRVVFAKKPSETKREQQLRLQKEASYKWQQEYWTEHNNNFNKSKKKFIEARKTNENESDKKIADDMSVFYKDFLDQNYNAHKKFLWGWYKRNFKLLWPSFLVMVEKLTKSVQQKYR